MCAEACDLAHARSGVFAGEVDEIGGAQAEDEVAFVGGVDADYLGAQDFAVLNWVKLGCEDLRSTEYSGKVPAKCPRPPPAPTTTSQLPGRGAAFRIAWLSAFLMSCLRLPCTL